MIFDVAAGVVTYNPDLDKLRFLLENLRNQVGRIYVVDNASDNIEEVQQICRETDISDKGDGIRIIRNSENEGVAAALNQIMEKASDEDMKWVLLMDDDSRPEKNLVEKLYKGTHFKNVGIVCPKIKDINSGEILRNKGEKKRHMEKGYQTLDSCITAGSLVNLDAWFDADGYDEYLFMDFVDFDFCIRLRREGYRILQNNRIVMEHELGRTEIRRLLFKKVEVMNHSPMRKYYITRNRIYCEYKYNGRFGIRNAAGVVKALLLILFFEKDKRKKISAVLKGVKDGKRDGRSFRE